MKKIIASILLSFIFTLVSAQISLPKVFGDNMVLQRNISIPVWGTATPGSRIVVQLGTKSANSVVDSEGKWKVYLPKFKAGGPYKLSIVEAGKPDSQVEFDGVLIGDVWVASGQSNMEWSVKQSNDATNEIANAKYPQIRLIFVEHDKKLSPVSDISSGEWKVCNPENVKDFSAVAYFFARKVHIDHNIPVGIIQSAWGGTPVEAWMSREVLLSTDITKNRVLSNDTLTYEHFYKDSINNAQFWETVYNPQNNSEKTVPMLEYEDSDWNVVEMPRVMRDFGIGRYEGMLWMRKKVLLPDTYEGKDLTLNVGYPEMNYSVYFNGVEICKSIWGDNTNHSYKIPADIVKKGDNIVAFRFTIMWGGGGIYPPGDALNITDGSSTVTLAGSWLYSTNVEPKRPYTLDYHYYPTILFNAMINPIIPYGIKGFLWYQGEANAGAAEHYQKLFPMMITDWRKRWGQGDLPFLYVQLANYMKQQDEPSESMWAELREAQTMTLALKNTGMACIIDIGDADDIHPGNKQDVGKRLALIANNKVYKKRCVASGPMFKNYKIAGDRVRVKFDLSGSSLETCDNGKLVGFEVAGSDRKFYWAEAYIKGNEVVVYSDKVKEPVAVRYAWADNPNCNLVNTEGLPAVPFRTNK